MDNNHLIKHTNFFQICQICGNQGAQMAYGVLSCSPCKVFFRRNYQMNLENDHCLYDNQCEININNRRICKYCRLRKCYSVGMQKELIRASHPKQNKLIEKVNSSLSLTQPIVNLLHNNQSFLTNDQWIVIENLIHSNHQQSPLSNIEKTISSQSNYPAKIRFKMATEHIQFLAKNTYLSIGLVIKQIPQFIHLSINDQNTLIERNIRTVGSIDAIELFNNTNLCQISYYYDSSVALYNSTLINQMLTIAHRSKKNDILFKLIMPILFLSTSSDILDPTFHITNNPHDVPGGIRTFSNTLNLLNLQNFYVEILFKYMSYQYGYEQASLKFDQIIKTSLDQTLCLADYRLFREHHQMVQTIVNTIEQSLILTEL